VVGKGERFRFSGSLAELYATAEFIPGLDPAVSRLCNIPLVAVPPFWARGDPPVRIFARLGDQGDLYVGERSFGHPHFFRRADIVPLEGDGRLFEGDRALVDTQMGAVVAVSGGTALFLPDSAMLAGKPPVLVDAKKCAVLATLAGPGVVDGQDYSVQIAQGPFLPNDLCFSGDRTVRIAGSRAGGAVGHCGKKVVAVDEVEFKLLCRFCSAGEARVALRSGVEDVAVSLLATDFAGLGVLPGDAVAFDGANGVVAGYADGYVWILAEDGGLFPVDGGEDGIELKERPARDLAPLFKAMVGPSAL
jgi:hypothetical protein